MTVQYQMYIKHTHERTFI